MKATLLKKRRFTPTVFVRQPEKSRKGDWIQTYTGRKFWPLDPRVGDWCIVDIAHSLSMHPRFGGHTIQPYYVSQHSLFVSERVPEQIAMEGLLHDGHESIYLDFPRPLKNCFPEYSIAEKKGARTLRQQFGIPTWFVCGLSMHPVVKKFDNIALVTERRDLMRPTGFQWAAELEQITPDNETIRPMSSVQCEAAFMRRFLDLV